MYQYTDTNTWCTIYLFFIIIILESVPERFTVQLDETRGVQQGTKTNTKQNVRCIGQI